MSAMTEASGAATDSDDTWEAVRRDFLLLRANPESKPFQSVLALLEPAINLGVIGRSDDKCRACVRGALSFVDGLKSDVAQGRDVQTKLEQVKGGFVQPDWRVTGDVKQANRDYIDKTVNQYITKIIIQGSRDLDLSDLYRSIPVPVVLVVMTAAEVQGLFHSSKSEASSLTKTDELEALLEHLNSKCGNWASYYGPTGCEWRPFGGDSGPTIEELTRQTLDRLSEGDQFPLPLAPEFFDIRSLCLPERRATLRRIRNKGCIVVLDVISMRHPDLYRAFHHSLLDAYPRTSVVSIAPSQTSYDLASKLAIQIQMTVQEMEFSLRATDMGDFGASERVFDGGRLSTWLSTRVREIELLRPEQTRGVPGFFTRTRST